jgi:hypothetical protein
MRILSRILVGLMLWGSAGAMNAAFAVGPRVVRQHLPGKPKRFKRVSSLPSVAPLCQENVELVALPPIELPSAESLAEGRRLEAQAVRPLERKGLDGIIVKCAKCWEKVPEQVRKWSPFLNETANLLQHSFPFLHGIYAGPMKPVVDAAAATAMLGNALSKHPKGKLAMGLNFAAAMGVTFYLPNACLAPALETIPKYLGPLGPYMNEGVGRCLLGISLIAVLEQAYEFAAHKGDELAHAVDEQTDRAKIGKAQQERNARKARGEDVQRAPSVDPPGPK